MTHFVGSVGVRLASPGFDRPGGVAGVRFGTCMIRLAAPAVSMKDNWKFPISQYHYMFALAA